MIRRWCLYLAGLLGCLIFLLAYQGWVAWLMLMALLWLPILSLVVSLPAMFTVRAEIKCPETVKMGESAELRAQVRAAMPMPPYRVRIRVENAQAGTYQVLSVGEQLPTEHAAVLHCKPYRCRAYDYLGLFGIPMVKTMPDAVIVWPKPLEMKMPSRMERVLSLGWRPKPGGGFAEQHYMRLYRPGDSANLIHWKLSAKTGKLIVREPMEPILRKIVVSMDLMGTLEELDRKFGRLLWVGQYLFDQELPFELRVTTGTELAVFSICTQKELHRAVRLLMHAPLAGSAGELEGTTASVWHCHIGGEPDEA